MTHAVRKRLLQLGYQVHTPGEVFGTKADAYGAEDTTWLAKVARTGWVVLNRDAKIMQRPHELAAYLAAKVHMFYLPGQATRAQLLSLVEANLEEVVTYAHARRPGVWRIAESGVHPFPVRKPKRDR